MPQVTIVLPVSRSDYLKKVFYNLEQLECDREQTTLLTVVDGDNALLQEVKTHVLHSKFKGQLYIWHDKGTPTTYGIYRRRRRIADIHQIAKANVPKDTEYVFGIEDDTLFKSDTLKQLMATMLQKKGVGFVSGIQLGRWGTPHLGAWHVDDVYESREITSAEPGQTGVQTIDAAGFYCFLTTASIYTGHTFQPFQEILGPDVDFGIALRQQGLMNYIDYGVQCTHLHNDEAITFQNTQPVVISFRREHGTWGRGDV